MPRARADDAVLTSAGLLLALARCPTLEPLRF
jgi:hypothetical protein